MHGPAVKIKYISYYATIFEQRDMFVKRKTFACFPCISSCYVTRTLQETKWHSTGTCTKIHLQYSIYMHTKSCV